MPPHTLTTIGEALYGSQWQSELARALGVNDRTVRRWAAGKNAMPEGISEELSELCAERGKSLVELAAKLRRSAEP